MELLSLIPCPAGLAACTSVLLLPALPVRRYGIKQKPIVQEKSNFFKSYFHYHKCLRIRWLPKVKPRHTPSVMMAGLNIIWNSPPYRRRLNILSIRLSNPAINCGAKFFMTPRQAWGLTDDLIARNFNGVFEPSGVAADVLIGVEDFFEGGQEVVDYDDVPAHILGDAAAIFNHRGDFGMGLWQEHKNFVGNISAFGGFNLVADVSADGEEVGDIGELGIDGGVIGDDDVSCAVFGRCVCAGDGVANEAGAAGDVAEDAEAAEGEGFDGRDAEGFVDALGEFDVCASVDIDGVHIGGHFHAAEFSIEAKLIDEDDFYAFGFRVEFLDGGIEGRLAA